MKPIDVSIAQLRGLIGRQVWHDDIQCEIVEILEDGPSLVLRSINAEAAIQPDRHGDAHRRVPTVFTVPVLTEDGTAWSNAFLKIKPPEL